MNKLITILLIVSCLYSCSESSLLFENPKPEDTGVDFSNTLRNSEDLNILDYLYYYNGGGVALGDINNDGLADIYFSGNQVENKLFLNKGNLKFEDISAKAGVRGESSWNTGSVMADINGDGLLDVYVCAVVGINGFRGHNELFINNGDNTFSEKAADYGLDFDTFSSNAAFLDYDQDGDLDMYLLNHAVHTQQSYEAAESRAIRNNQTGDRLLRNDNGVFTDVSEAAGIFGGSNGYGLGLAVSDFNNDGYPDIYVGNDFHEDDYYYINNQNGTFTESVKEFFGHTSRFSMGNDVADINHDGWPDIFTLDMLPEDEKVLKASQGDDNIQIQRLRTERFGYHHQFSRNMLHINQQNNTFLETAIFSDVSATDWSWSALFADYNQDGEQDIFISTGIPKRPNNLDFINFVSNEQIRNTIDQTKIMDNEALQKMPSGNVHNYFMEGTKSLQFKDRSSTWIFNDTLISGATAIGDLDNDGDLDIVTNNLNATATLYINNTNETSNYLKLKFDFSKKNPFGLGTKVYSYHKGILQYRELYTVRGFQASSEPIIHFGYGDANSIDSLKIVWPNLTTQLLKNVQTNQTLILKPENNIDYDYNILNTNTTTVFKRVKNNLGIDFEHTEDRYTDFNRQKLIPFQLSDRGPALAHGDLNNDGKKDLFFGGSKFYPSKVFIQKDSLFEEKKFTSIAKDSIKEDVAAVISDFNNDGKNDLITGSGGGDFYAQTNPLTDTYFVQQDSLFKTTSLPEMYQNAAVILKMDFDIDGDEDLFIGNQAITNDYGKIPKSFLLKNDAGNFTVVANKAIENVGMVTDALYTDFDDDGVKDLIVIGEWMSPTFFKNSNGNFIKIDMVENQLNGLWQTIAPFDIDADGDTDYMLGNWGVNSKFKASEKAPLLMYYGDFDANGQTETVTAISKNGAYYTLENLDELSAQLVGLKKKFPSYAAFAGRPIADVFDKETLNALTLFSVNELRSGFLRNTNGKFSFVTFNNELQISPITAFLVHDFLNNGQSQLLAAGNYFGVKPFHGRFDSFPGVLIIDENQFILGGKIGLDFSKKSARHLTIISLQEKEYLLATFNNEKAQVYQFK